MVSAGYMNFDTGVIVEDTKPIGTLKGFSDLQDVSWAKEAIEDMSIGTYKGLFSGTTSPDANGLAKFSPNDKMTRAEFLTVVTRALYSDQLAALPKVSGEFWYENNYDVALDNGLIKETEYEFSDEALNKAIPRQEMALILTRACQQRGEEVPTLVSIYKIADYSTVGDYYKEAVRTAYTKGLIAGKDSRGSFAPHDTLTRAEGATVLYRLVNASKRVKVTTTIVVGGQGNHGTTGGTTQDVNAPITIYQGRVRYDRPAKAGDTFVKSDGTSIILQLGPNGILGEGQGVAADVGLLGQITETGCDSFGYKRADYGDWWDSTGERHDGNHLQNNSYYINKTTGEGYWRHELQKLEGVYPEPEYDGTNGEVSSDPLHLYVYKKGMWWSNFICE